MSILRMPRKEATGAAPRSAARQVLADAIAAAAVGSTIVEERRQAVKRARGLVDASTERLVTAQANLERAKIGRADALLDSFTSGSPVKSGDEVRQARHSEEDASEALTVAGTVLERANDAFEAAQRDNEISQEALKKAAADVLTAQIDDQMACCRRIVVKLKGAQQVLAFLEKQRHVGVYLPLQSAYESFNDNPLVERIGDEFNLARHAAEDQMQAAFAALLSDPDAPLPTGEIFADEVPV